MIGPTVSVPEVGRGPDQPRLAEQLVALEADQRRVEVIPAASDIGSPVRLIFGGAAMSTDTVRDTEAPEASVHVSAKLVAA